MNAVRVLLGDRKRAQRGSVLSGVLIITAFLAIIAAALMTELSTNFLLSRALVNRVATEATVNSAMELALNQLQNNSISPQATGCPSLIPATASLNGQTAIANYLNCWPVTSTSPSQLTPTSGFVADGTHATLPGPTEEYMVGDSGGTVYIYGFSSLTSRSFSVGSAVTGPPMAMPDATDQPDISNLIPQPNGVALLNQANVGRSPTFVCTMAANGAVKVRPAPGSYFPSLTFFGDSTGALWAYDASHQGRCALQATTFASMPIVAGPVVFPHGAANADEIYVIASDTVSSTLLRYSYTTARGLQLQSSLPLAAPRVSGIALEKTSLPAGLAITFNGGTISLVQLQANFAMTPVANATVPTAVAGAPYWCHCPTGDQIGIGGQDGGLYLFDRSLSPAGSYAGGSPIKTTPIADSAGDWFFGADDGYLYEVGTPPNRASVSLNARFASMPGNVGSSPQLGRCQSGFGICIYLAQSDGSAYLVQLDARAAVLASCIGSLTVQCSAGANPRLWAQVNVGSAISPMTVHVSGWSYYSP